MSAGKRLRVGVAGLGRAFTLMLPAFKAHPCVALVAAADPRAEARSRFAAEFGGKAYESVADLCADSSVEAVYVATPHELHAEHAIAAAKAGKHVLVEKPMAISLEEARAMVEAARASNVHLVVGHSHSFDAPVARAREIVASGEVGRVRMITALNFTDFLYRPRRPEELDTAKGGGVLFSQAAHQVDVVRLLADARVTGVRAQAGSWDPARPTEGAYSALLTFAGGAFAALSYSGYGHFDSDEFCQGIGELGVIKDAGAYGAARRALAAASGDGEEVRAKETRGYGGAKAAGPAQDTAERWHEHFGVVIVSCERADLRPLPSGVMVYGDQSRRHEALEASPIPRAEVLEELCDAALLGRAPLHDGTWGLATLEVCLAMLESSRSRREVALVQP